MDVSPRFADGRLAEIALSMGEPARAKILCSLLDGHARTATELAALADIAASTASAHLNRLLAAELLVCVSQGRHRYFRLADAEVAAALESLLVLAGRAQQPSPAFEPSTPKHLREARRCYDHLAGQWAVRLHDHARREAWLLEDESRARAYRLTDAGLAGFAALGLDMQQLQAKPGRRVLACACMDWSARSPHLGGALGAACLQSLLQRQWLEAELDSRAMRLTRKGLAGLQALLGPAADALPVGAG